MLIGKKRIYKNLFGNAISTIFPLRLVAKQLDKYAYAFTPEKEYLRILDENLLDGRRLYWIELLQKAHLTASTSIFRTIRWVDAMANSFQRKNYLSFGASFRGFLEASADTVFTLKTVPLTLATGLPKIRRILMRDPTIDFFQSHYLENALTHYSYARSPSEVKKVGIELGVKLSKTHNAEKTRKYLDSFGTPRVHDCYGILCEITHPSAISVWSFIESKSEKMDYLRLSKKLDTLMISRLLDDYCDVSEKVLQITSNISILTLKVLNAFESIEVSTPIVNKIRLDNVPVWKEIEPLLVD